MGLATTGAGVKQVDWDEFWRQAVVSLALLACGLLAGAILLDTVQTTGEVMGEQGLETGMVHLLKGLGLAALLLCIPWALHRWVLVRWRDRARRDGLRVSERRRSDPID